MTATPVIDISALTKRYPGTKTAALSKLDLTVAAGEVYGFLGSNGAGKTTTIRCLLNFLRPSAGTIRIAGLDSVRDSVAVKRQVGYLSGEFSLWRKLTGNQLLDYLSELQPLKTPSLRAELVKVLQAEVHQPLGTLSKGNRQKIGLIQAFMHEPAVLILDEPTSGLDPLMQEVFFKLIHDAQQRGAAVFVSSHNFSEVDRMCDRVGFIRSGKLVAEQSMSELVSNRAHTYDIGFSEPAPVVELRRLPGIKVTAHDERHVSVELRGELSPLLALLGRHKVVQLEHQTLDLEKEFLRFYGQDKAL